MIRTNYRDKVLSNYEAFINEHYDDFATPGAALEMLTSDGSFRAYIEALTDGLPAPIQESVFAVANRQREFLLEESAADVGPMSSVIGYAVTYFPILVDIYSDPVLSLACTVYPTRKPIVSVPRYRIKGTVKNPDGSVQTWYLPRPQNLVRGSTVNLNITPGDNVDLFGLVGGGVTPDNARINKRYFMITSLNITDDAGGSTPTYDVPVLIRPDARGQIEAEVPFDDSAGNAAVAKVIGNVNWDTGIVVINATFTGSATFTFNYATSRVMFSPTTGDIGRVKVTVEMEMWDINVDVRDDFEFELQTEQIQDYRDIYNIDLIASQSQAIKTQIMLNKDQDISFFLEANEPEMHRNGAFASVDLDSFTVTGGDYRPANVLDIFKGVVPVINMTARKIYENYRAAPQYILAGNKTSALLDSLQEFVINMPSVNRGEAGFVARNIDFKNFTILPCLAIPDDKIYVLYKAPADKPEYTSILDIVYQPLYFIEEITNSMKRTFVKSRTAIEVVSPHALGCIKVEHLDDYLMP